MTDFNTLVDQVNPPDAQVQPPVPQVAASAPQSDNAQPNKFDSLVDQVTSDRQTQAQAVNASLQQTDPDQFAKATDVGKQLGLPAQAVMPNLDDYASRMRLQQNNDFVQNNPALATWVANRPDQAGAASDDFAHLDMLSKAAVALVQGIKQPIIEGQLGFAGLEKQAEGLVGSDVDSTDQKIANLQGELRSYNQFQPTGGYKVAQTGVAAVTSLVDALAHAVPEAAAGSLMPGVGTAAGATFGTAVYFGATAAGNHYLSLQNAIGKDGQPMPEYAKQLSSTFVGGLTFALGNTGAGPEIDAIAQNITSDAVKQAMTRPSVVSSLTELAKGTVIAGSHGAAMMGAFTGAQQLGSELAKEISPGQWETINNSPELRKQYTDQLVDSIESGALMFGPAHMVGGAIGEYGRYRQSQNDIQSFNTVMDGSAESKTRTRSPDAFQTFMQSQVNDTPVENVYVPAAKVAEVYQKAGVNPSADDGLFGKAVPDIAEQMQQAMPRNGDIVIPTANYATHIAGTPMDAQLRPDMRVSADGMSMNEMNEFRDKYQDILSQMGDHFNQQQTADEPLRAIQEDVANKAQQAGFTENQSTQYGALAAARYSTRAERLGVDPMDLYRETGLEIRQGESGEDPEKALQEFPAKQAANALTLDDLEKQSRDQIKGENGSVSDLLDQLKSSTEQKKTGDQSLIRWLANKGGVKDDGGDLKAMDADKAHISFETGKAIPFAKKLINPKGMNLDDAARAAEEAGFIKGKEGRATINELKEAISQDLSKRDTLNNNAHTQTHDLDALLNQHGIEYKDRDNADIIKDMESAGLIGSKFTDEFYQKINDEGQESIPGTDKSAKQAAQSKEAVSEGRLRSKVAQKPADEGLFSDARNQRELFQNTGQSERGKITMAEGQKIITLFEGADKSTLLHEFGHMWLDELRADALGENAPQQLRDDWNTVKKFIGQEDNGKISEEGHEKIARSFEKYLMDGKAPSNALRQAFRSFKRWMTNIYRSVKGLNVDVTPDVREVFDRMLASDDDIVQVEKRDEVERLFKTPKDAGMTDAEFKAYNDAATNVAETAREHLLTEAMGAIKKKNDADWNRAEKELRPDVEKEIDSQHDIRSYDYFKTSKMRDENGEEAPLPKMDIGKAALQSMYTDHDDIESELPKAIQKVVSKDGMNPDDIAPLLGYTSGREMMDDLLGLGKVEKDSGKLSPRDYLVAKDLNSKLSDKFGLSYSEMRDRAEELVAGADRMDLKLAEVRALGRKLGKPVGFTRENITAWSKEQIGSMKAKDAANTYSFVRAMAKAGTEARNALEKGDDEGAYQALQRQALNMAMVREARAFETEYKSGLKNFRYIASKPVIKSTDQEYLNQAHALLKQFGIQANRDPKELKNALGGKSLADFLDEKRAEGRAIYTPDFIASTQPRTIKSLSSDEFMALKDSVASIMHNGRDEQTIYRNDQKISRQQLRDEILAQRRPGEKINTQTMASRSKYAQTTLKKLGDGAMKFLASLRRSEDVMQALDNDKALGPHQTSFYIPLSLAADREMEMLAEEKKSWDGLRDVMPDDWEKFLKQTIVADELPDENNEPHQFKGDQVLHMALNIGNESNLDKMLRGEGWSETGLRGFLDRTLDKHHWDLVQGIIDRFEYHWPETEKLYRDLNGVAPTKIEPLPINTKFGTYRGGYFPIMYDEIRSAEMLAKTGQTKIDENSPIGKGFSFLNGITSSGRTIERTEAAYPLLYDLDMVVPKLNEAIHDLAFRRAIINANKFLGDPTIASEIQERAGTDAYRQLQHHVNDIARPYKNDRSLEGMNKMISYLRQNIVSTGILFRASTIAKHFSSAFSQSFGELGPTWMGHGLKSFWSDPAGVTKWAYDNSPFMRYRMDQIDIDQRHSFNKLLGESGINQAVRTIGHYGVGLSDQITAIPTFKAAYDKAISQGASVKDSFLTADQAVRNAHGGARMADIPAFLRGNEFVKIFTPFYTFLNHMYNRGMLRTGRDIKYGMEKLGLSDTAGATQDFASAAARTFFYFVLPGMAIGNLLPGDEKDGWLARSVKGIVGENAGTIPFVRSIADGVMRGKDISFSPFGRAIDTMASTAKDAATAVGLRAGNVSKKWIQHAMDTVGYTTGVPIGGQPAAATQYLWDVSRGNEKPQNVQDWVHGLMYGHGKQ